MSRITMAAAVVAAIAIAAASAFLLAWVRPPGTTIAGPPATASPARHPDKVVVGLVIALSGAQAEAGADGLAGILAAAKWVNEVRGASA